MISMLRLINPPGHTRRSTRTPGYVKRKARRNATAPGAGGWASILPKVKRPKKKAKRVAAAAKKAKPRKRVAKPRKRTSSAHAAARAREIAVLAAAIRSAAPRSKRKRTSPKKGTKKMARKRHTKRGRARNARGQFVKKATTKRRRHRKATKKAAAPKRRRRRKAAKVVVVHAAPKRRRRKHTKKAAAPRRRRRRTTKHVTHRRRRVRYAPLKRRPRRGGRLVKVITVTTRKKPRRRRPVGIYKIRTRGKHRRVRVTARMARIRRNPIEGMKGMIVQGALLYGGLLGMRAVNKLIKDYVVSNFASSLPAQIAPIIPSAIGFIAAAFAPKVIKNSPQLVGGIQTGATLALLDAVMKNLVLPQLPANVQGFFAGIDDVGYSGYGRFGGYGRAMGEYLQQPRQIGAHVEEAMALDEYVQDGGMSGFDVQEALADSEVQGMQSGYAAGSLAKTLFSV